MVLFCRAEVDEKRLRELEDTVRMKNKQIHQLLEDIEQVSQKFVIVVPSSERHRKLHL